MAGGIVQRQEEGEGIVTYIGKCKAMTPHYRKGTYVRCDVCVSGGRRVGALDRGCRSNREVEKSFSSKIQSTESQRVQSN